MTPQPRRFQLHRDHDVSGVSGLGIVAEGVLFSDGHAAIHWLGEWPTTTPHASMQSIEAVHGHGGSTRIVWLDPTGTPEDQDDASVQASPSDTSDRRYYEDDDEGQDEDGNRGPC